MMVNSIERKLAVKIFTKTFFYNDFTRKIHNVVEKYSIGVLPFLTGTTFLLSPSKQQGGAEDIQDALMF